MEADGETPVEQDDGIDDFSEDDESEEDDFGGYDVHNGEEEEEEDEDEVEGHSDGAGVSMDSDGQLRMVDPDWQREEFRRKLGEVMDMDRMTSSKAWGRIYDWIQSRIASSSLQLRNVDNKPREDMAYKQTINILLDMLTLTKRPVNDFRTFLDGLTPEFRKEMDVDAAWNEELGRVIIDRPSNHELVTETQTELLVEEEQLVAKEELQPA